LFDLAIPAKENKEMDNFIRSTCGRLITVKRFRSQISSRAFLATVIFLTLTMVSPAFSAGPSMKTATHHHRWYQIGKASWYGGRFQGRKTANGEPYDMNQLTCAHRTLPLGTWLKVTNLHNRKTVFVRVSDRGPVPEDRIIDLSYAAAQSIGISGLGQVRIEKASLEDPEVAEAMLDQVHLPPIIPRPLLPGLR
jgi:rare lipoprotein A